MSGLELELTVGGSIEGFVLVGAGASAAGTIVAVNRGDGGGRTERVGSDGFYRFERLMPGAWQVVELTREISSDSSSTSVRGGAPASIPEDCRVGEGETTRFDLVLGGFGQGIEVLGRLTLNGAVPGPWRAELMPQDNVPRPGGEVVEVRVNELSTTLDPSGEFRLRAPKPGRWRLILKSPSDDGLPLMMSRELELDSKGTRLDLDLEVGSVHVQGLAPPFEHEDPMEMTLDVLSWSDGVWTTLVALLANEGEAHVPVMPTGRVQVIRVPLHVLDLGPIEIDAYPVVATGELHRNRELELRLQ